MAKKKVEDIDSLIAEENIIDCDVQQELTQAYIDYSMQVIIDRAFPEVRDGMKPVQRRILYTGKVKGYENNKPYIKSAKYAGDVMGSFHPHGDCYGTIANLAKPWEQRYPLIDFHGNLGSLDGDSQGSSRYTECRLGKTAYEILEDTMDKHSVEFKPNYSETEEEPVVLPALFPNFLANGCPTGIAVGYTSCVPSHNLTELCDMLIYALQNDNYTLKDLMKYLKGPDFPYGSQMLKEGIKSLYEKGEGRLTFRANYKVENNNETGNPQIVFTDMPPYSNKPKILEKIDALINNKELPRALSVRDESTGMEEIRIVVECMPTANVSLIVQDIYEKTKLQANASFYMRGILNKELKLVTLMDYVDIYLNHRYEVCTNRYNYLIDVSNKKLNIQRGLAKIIDDIKKAVNIIIDSETVAEAKEKLMKKYSLNDEQVEYVLEQKTRSLVNKDRKVIFTKIADLEKLINETQEKLDSKDKMKEDIVSQLEELKSKFGDKRRTKIVSSFDNLSESVEDIPENVIAVLYANGKVNVYEEDEFKKFEDSKTYKDKSNMFRQILPCKRSDDLLIINKTGVVERVPMNSLQYNNMKFADAINFIVYDLESEKTLVSVLKNGNVKKTFVNKMKFKINKPTQIIKDMDSEIVVNKLVDDKPNEAITMATNNGFVGRFSVNSFTATACGARAMGTSKFDDGDFVVDCKISNKEQDGENKMLILFSYTDDTLGYKVMNLSDLLVKGRTARALNCISGKKFAHLNEIHISDGVFRLLDNKNKMYEFKKYNITDRLKKGEPFNMTTGMNHLID